MQAIAACSRCGKSVCLDHHARFDGKVVCHDDYRTLAAARREELERDEQEAWAQYQAALDAVRRRGPAGSPDETAAHSLTEATFDTYAQSQMGDIGRAELAALRPGGACPVHTAGTCTVRSTEKSGRLSRRVTRAECEMPLWRVEQAHSLVGVWYVNSRGELFSIHGGSLTAITNNTPMLFDTHVNVTRRPRGELIRETAEHIAAITA
jgi:hypothetical protein